MKTKLKSIIAYHMAVGHRVAAAMVCALCAVGLSAFAADPSVTVGEVTAGEPWSTITVNYTLGGTDAKTDYKVAFDVTAGGQIAGVTNDATKLTDGAATKEIDTAKLFSKQVVDTKAKVKVSLIAIKAKAKGGFQLWEGGPFWAEVNLGATTPEEYGILTNFIGAAQAVTDALGAGWRVPSDVELKMLDGENDGDKVCSNVWTTCNGVNGRRFFGMTPGYEDKSIFLPAAGYDEYKGSGRASAGNEGGYWSSSAGSGIMASYLHFIKGSCNVYNHVRSYGRSVRAVRDAK